MKEVSCNLCGLNDAHVWGEKKGMSMVKCNGCGLVYCNPMPENNELESFYGEDYFLDGRYDDDEKRHAMYQLEIEEIMSKCGQRRRFLDVGCAIGKFLLTLPETYEKWGTEYSAAASEIGRNKYGLKILTGRINELSLPVDYFDIVQLRGVLEHSLSPLEDLVRIRSLLKTSGILRISQLPNIESFCARLFKGNFNQVKPGEHLYYFSPQTIRLALEKAGFAITEISYPYLKTPYASLIRDILRIPYCLINDKESPAFFGNMMIVYAIKHGS